VTPHPDWVDGGTGPDVAFFAAPDLSTADSSQGALMYAWNVYPIQVGAAGSAWNGTVKVGGVSHPATVPLLHSGYNVAHVTDIPGQLTSFVVASN
jgi:hypothetical protein